MRYKITFKDGKTEAIFADRHEQRDDLHLFFKSNNKPHTDIFFESTVVVKVEPWPTEKPNVFIPIRVDKPTDD